MRLAAVLLGAVALLAAGCGGAADERSAGSPPAVADVVRDPADVPPPVTRLAPRRVHVHLVAREVVAELAPGKRYRFWTYALAGGKPAVPGPLIRVRAGDTLVVSLTNDARNAEPHGVDFHAAMGPGGGTDMMEVDPGETRTFTFTVRRPGAYLYHCGAEGKPWEHVSHGMFGLIQVDPPGGLPSGYRELYVGQSEWYLTDEASGGVFGLDEAEAEAETPDYVTLNGNVDALTSPRLSANSLRVRQGEKLRVFFANGGPDLTSSFHVIGAIFDRVLTAGREHAATNEETVAVPPGSAAVFELSTAAPGPYPFVDHALWRAARGATGYLFAEPAGA